ncbi:hypothetical protein B0T26DRAFT_676495 [Lasiosphaeria miniovina]|uniref:Uncharacterized protein n=1 Tax=Lasiosphaeria miniovina TaxID=1954250 RepID=A0AA40AM00_9PEZI|nr:uncharacterized protein B0T26DRAFT_676495 [Lasiosphaeria miniovina]KAK0718315.1 hypothetical protein B0T26DRAFT_676495 [Lasiosphaeria miniovina]
MAANLIACIYPYDSLLYAVETINMRESQSRRIMYPDMESQNLNMYSGDYALELRFNEAQGPSKGQGLVFGTNPDSDIVLPRSKCLKDILPSSSASASASAGGEYPLVVVLHRDLKFHIMASDHDVNSALYKAWNNQMKDSRCQEIHLAGNPAC